MTTLLARTAPAQAPTPARKSTWPTWALFGLLAATAVLYLWNLSGYGNSFYAAAVQAGTQSWKAWLFGSLDSGNAITVDKPPGALWVTTLFTRLFGFSDFTVLAPQALMGVASVALLHATVKRTNGPVAGLLAGAALAVTPVAVLMFRFNNPDALLVLLMVAAAYCVVRALEKAGPWWLVLAGTAIGFAFLTKMMQAFLVLPAFVLVYLVAAPTSLGRRLAHLAAAAGAVVVSAGWFIALVELWPADSRPYIGGSTDNSLLELALGYNGLSRLTGGEGNGGGMGGGNTGFGGSTGLFRMFGASFGGEISWLLPAALVALVAGLWFTRRAPRTDRTRAALLLWGGWLVVTAGVFSFMDGTTHPYYSVALAPAIAALVAIGGRELWRARSNRAARGSLAGMVAVTAAWDYVLLSRGDYPAVLKLGVLFVGLVVAALLVVGARAVVALALAAVLVTGAGTTAFALSTASVAHSGSIPTSGPSGGAGMGGMGGERSTDDTAVTALLSASTARWAAATTGAQSAASLELASGRSVMAIGGWSGSDDSPTLDQFKAYVAAGEVDYYVVGGQGGGGRGGSSSAEILAWVQANYTAKTVGGTTVYEL
ncbi:glycosyltransferase family 39 protein [Actinosynnema sp. NPDC020468]|uniref:ArnT family glycosyltransferase n=1 Tax=Actinosynnema sp. NPDC020468 TaxID=3154488 RepID=UPI0033D55D70